MTSPGQRVGWGFDAHRLNDQPPTNLGGVVVSDTVGVDATSDGDVLAHALTDAILGACALGDIGQHFPSNDPRSEGADSMDLLRSAVSMARGAGFRPQHCDLTVVVQDIRVSPHRTQIADEVAAALSVPPSDVSVKATTTDGLGFIGEGDGIACVAVVTVAPLT